MAEQSTQIPNPDQLEANGGTPEARGSGESASGNRCRLPPSPHHSPVLISDNFIESQADDSAGSSIPANKCACCNALETDPEKPLKPCAKCQTVRYCSRDCQKKDWKLHKKTCATAAQIYAQNANLKPASAPRVPKKEGHRGGLQKWQFDT
jgi:hypothetical protein